MMSTASRSWSLDSRLTAATIASTVVGLLRSGGTAVKYQAGFRLVLLALRRAVIRAPGLAILPLVGPRTVARASGRLYRGTPPRVNHPTCCIEESIRIFLVREVAEVVDLGLVPHVRERVSTE